jgi:predicted negative regulator of RcsB-dependent stress response
LIEIKVLSILFVGIFRHWAGHQTGGAARIASIYYNQYTNLVYGKWENRTKIEQLKEEFSSWPPPAIN